MNFKTRCIGLAVCCILLSAVASFGAENDQASPDVFFPEVRHEFASVAEGQDVTVDFIVQNRGAVALLIENVRTG